MKKLFLTSGLAIMIAGSAFAQAHDIDTDNQLVGTNPAQDASCQEPTLGLYNGNQTFHAKWVAKTYTVTYAGASNTSGTGISNTATFDDDYSILGLGTGTGNSGITANTGYHFSKWVGQSTGQNPDTTYNALPETDRTYEENDTIQPYQVVGNLTLTAHVLPNDSGAISLHADIYRDNDRTTYSTPLYYNSGTNVTLLDTPITQTTVYSRYATGLYTTDQFTTQVTASTMVPVQAGYTFNGFWTEDGQTKVINNDGSVLSAALTQVSSIGGTANWYAKWTPNVYGITFNKGSANCATIEGNSPTTQNLTYDLATPLSSNGYSATGYTFGGWNSNKNLLSVDGTGNTTHYTNGQSIAMKYTGEDAVLTAQWNYIQTGEIVLDNKLYNAQGTEIANHTQTASVPASLQIKYGQSDGYSAFGGNGVNKVTTTPTMVGYDFGGYYTEKNGAGTLVIEDDGDFIQCTTNTQIATADQGATWYAKWTAKPGKIKYSCGSKPSGASTDITNNSQAPAEVSTDYDQSYTLASGAPNCSLPGYHFKGWHCTYNIDTGSNNSGNGYDYVGTLVEENNPNVYTLSQSVTYRVDRDVSADVTCSVIWEANTIGTIWNAGSGELTDNGLSTCTFDSNVIGIPVTAPERPGYDFDGWTVSTPANP